MGQRSRKKGCCGWFLVLLIAAIIALAIVITVKRRNRSSKPELGPVPGPPGAVQKKYGDALKIAMQFFDVQKSGKLVDNKISWRGDSAIKDGSEAKLDLSKGMYDAGDHIKFGFPLAFTATVLSWAILEYGDQMQTVDQLEPAQDSLKWITDYLIEAHPKDNVLYIQVGDPKTDHGCWDRPEAMTEKRPLTQVNTSFPGTEVAAETAAAMASASLVFKSTDSTYSATLLKHAKQLFSFADKHRGFYSESVPEVQTYYNSTGYGDELLWAATWLYHATGDQSYFDYATGENGEEFARWGSPTWFSWDNKLAGTQVLLSRVSFFGSKDTSNSATLQKYRKTAEAVMCLLLPKSPSATSSRTDRKLGMDPYVRKFHVQFPDKGMTTYWSFDQPPHGNSAFEPPIIIGVWGLTQRKIKAAYGLIWVSEWNALQHPVASSFLAVLYSDYMLTSRTATLSCGRESYGPSDLRKFAISQVDYVLGDNPMKMSYLVGYGDTYPEYVHHRGASIPADATTGCKNGWKWLESTDPNPNVAIGAVVGGPFLNETYVDSRNNSMQGEPTTYNSAAMVGLLSGLITTSSVVKSFA